MIAICEVTDKGRGDECRHIYFVEDIIAGIHAVELGMDVVEIPEDTDMGNADAIIKLFEEN